MDPARKCQQNRNRKTVRLFLVLREYNESNVAGFSFFSYVISMEGWAGLS